MRVQEPNGRRWISLILMLLWLVIPHQSRAQAGLELTAMDRQIKGWAENCRDEIVEQFELLLTSGQLSMGQIFDTFYIPIPDTEPQKFHTQNDLYIDGSVQHILDKYLKINDKISFVVLVDRNGYLPTHNSKYSRPLTGDRDLDTKWSRSKRLFNDRTGLSAARNKEPFLLQRYSRDTGEQMADLSVPIMLRGRHWGAVRFGYQK